MAKRRKNNGFEPNTWLIILGLILLVFLIGRGTFFGAFVTECENIEPQSIIEYTDIMLEENGTLVSDGTFTVGTTVLDKYLAESHLGTFELIVPDNNSCSQLLEQVHLDQNNTQYVVLNQRQVLMTDAGFMWCNYNNHIALRANSIVVLSNYYQKFEVCITSEVTPTTLAEYVTNETECGRLGGEFINDTCLCSDGSLLEIGLVCPEVEEPRATGSTSAFTPPTTTPTTTTPREDMSTTSYALTGLGILALLFSLYWFFEKGPDKGLIQKKYRGRRRK